MWSRRSGLFALALILGLAFAACGGGGNPAGPSDSAQGVTLVGTVVGASAGAASGASVSSTTDTITVTVQENPAITATVGADGTFTLRGLPEGSFTLVFARNGVPFGTLTFGGVNANQQITITVQVNADSVVLLEQRRNGIGHGDLEIEGKVEEIVLLNPAGESRFMIDGKLVVARPGETSIREGNRRRSVTDVAIGRRVHVKAVWLPMEGGSQPVLAHEIKLQGGDDNTGGGDDPVSGSFCPDAGRKAEVEGKITGIVPDTSITVLQQGKGPFLALVDTQTRIRKGNKTYTMSQLAVGNRVHVKGTSLGLSGDTCAVDASEIKLQN